MRSVVVALAVMYSSGVHAAAQAPDAADAPAAAQSQESVQVTGTRDPDFKPYRTMLLGLDAFEKYHALAPQAELKFVLRPQAGGDIRGVTLRIANEESSVPLPVADDGTFMLVRDPAIDTKDAELLTNRKKGSIRWRPLVLSPGVPEGRRRLGDLRLECAVRWAVEKEDMPFLQRNLLRALGACTSKRVRVNYHADKPLASATLREGTRAMELAKPGDPFFVPPLYDEAWSDEALVELRYEEPKT